MPRASCKEKGIKDVLRATCYVQGGEKRATHRVAPTILALLALLILATIFFWKIFFTGEVSITYNLFHEYPWKTQATEEQIGRASMNPDCVQSYFPRRAFATQTIRSGEIPLWNPYDFCGTPFLANFQSAVFYPVNLLLYLADPLRAMGYYLFIHFLLAGVFMFLFLRSRDLPMFASFSGAVILMFCGFLVTRVGHPTFVATAAWVPGLLWRAERLFQKPGLRRAILLGLCHGAMVLAGFPQIAFHGSYIMVLYAVYRAWSGDGLGGKSWRTLLWVLGAAVLSGCIALVQILPTCEFIRFCTRRFLPYESILSSAHHPASLIKYLAPDFLGNPLDGTVWSTFLHRADGHFSQNYVSTTGYVGILPLLLAWAGLFTRRRGILFFASTAVATLLIVFGTPLFRIAYQFPGFNFSRIDRIIFLYMFSMGVLAAWGIAGLELRGRETEMPRKRILLPITALVILFWSAFLVVNTDPSRLYGMITQGHFRPLSGWEDVRGGMIRAGILLALGGAAIGLRLWDRLPVNAFRASVLFLLLIDLLPFGYRFNITRPYEDAFPPTATTDRLQQSPEPARILRARGDVLFPNTAGVYGISDAQGYNALTLDYYMEIMERVQPGIVRKRRITSLTRPEAMESPIVDMLSVDYFLMLEKRGGGDPTVAAFPNADAMPRAFLVPRAEIVHDKRELLDQLASPEFDPSRVVYLTAPDGDPLPETGAATEAQEQSPGAARIVSYRTGEVVVETRAGRNCWLVLAETYYPGWRAWVDGEPAAIRRANHALRAVYVPAGRHEVRFRYKPMTFRVGATVSLVALGLGIVGLALPGRRKGEMVRGRGTDS